MVKAIAVLVAVLGGSSVLNASWTVCVEDNESLLNTPVRAAILREFPSVIGGRGARLEFRACPADSPRLQLAVSREPPDHLAGILGLARRRSDGMEPTLRVFHLPLVRYLGAPNNASVIGRAVARVAAHEVAHFLNQQPHHCANGLLRARFPAYELAARNRWPFRDAPHCDATETDRAGPGSRTDLGGEPHRAYANQRSDAVEGASPIR